MSEVEYHIFIDAMNILSKKRIMKKGTEGDKKGKREAGRGEREEGRYIKRRRNGERKRECKKECPAQWLRS